MKCQPVAAVLGPFNARYRALLAVVSDWTAAGPLCNTQTRTMARIITAANNTIAIVVRWRRARARCASYIAAGEGGAMATGVGASIVSGCALIEAAPALRF